MSRAFPPHVNVAIVGSGPTGAAYARILSELAPDATGHEVARPPDGPVLAGALECLAPLPLFG